MEVFGRQVDESREKIISIIEKNSEGYRNFKVYLDEVDADIEHFKRTGSFKPKDVDGKSTNTNHKNLNSTSSSSRKEQTNKTQVKLERVSNSSSENGNNSPANQKAAEVEKYMPPPQQLPMRHVKKEKHPIKIESVRCTRSKARKKENTEISGKANASSRTDTHLFNRGERDSDVICEKENVSTIILSDTEDEDIQKESAGSKRTHNKKKLSNKKLQEQNAENIRESGSSTISTSSREGCSKRSRSSSAEDKKKSRSEQSKKIKKNVKNVIPKKEFSLSKDAVSHSENGKPTHQDDQQISSTFVVEKSSEQNVESNANAPKLIDTTVVVNSLVLDATVILEKPTILTRTVATGKNAMRGNKPGLNVGDVMTDDESDENISPVKKNNIRTKTKTASKAIFSQFENSPVKKRVEAFERLGADATDAPVRITRTKTKAKEKQAKEAEEIEATNDQMKEKVKGTPIMAQQFMPSSISNTTSKIPCANRTGVFNNESLISAKSVSAIKASQQEFRERELKRREKEADALRKKDALLQAQIEDKRRKRQEKQLKAQQTREANEKNKQRMLELQKIKEDEKYKQIMADKQEKLQRQREEAERRRLQAIKKAQEEKRKEDERKKLLDEEERSDKTEQVAGQKLMKNKSHKHNEPIYMTQKAPLLPTDECYDSDESEAANIKVRRPDWTRRENMHSSLMAMEHAGGTIKNTFFLRKSQTPNLQDIFEGIDPRKLKRTSSAIWRDPPRFTLLPVNVSRDEDEDD